MTFHFLSADVLQFRPAQARQGVDGYRTRSTTITDRPSISRPDATKSQVVAVDLTRLKQLYCGVGQFSLHLGRALAGFYNDTIALELLLPFHNNHLLKAGGHASRSIAYPWMKERHVRFCRRWLKPFLPNEPRYALWHSTTQCVRFLPVDDRIPVVQTIHDLNFLREKSEGSYRRNITRVQALVDRACAVTTISHFVAKEVQEHIQLNGKPLKVIYNGVMSDDFPSARAPSFADDRPFLLSIGDIVPKKNFHVLIDLLKLLPQHRLIVAGNDRHIYANEIRQLAKRAGVANRTLLPGIVSDETRHWLYKNCTALVFPSLTEGFGLPAIEAMRFGKPVFLSNTTSLPEVAGQHAFYWSTFNADHMRSVFNHGMATFVSTPNYANLLKSHAKQYSWEKAAAEYIAFYREILFAR